jgi:type II secretory ATPase GspE/PulE/Tfp pilus assembly ATPase PilB-like protein
MPNPFEEYFVHLLSCAAQQGASDIHIEPFQGSLLIKFRVDSILRIQATQTEPNWIQRLCEIVKRMCGFNMGIAGSPQDTRFTVPGIPFDYRASLCPTMHGEKIVLRLLEQSKEFSLQAYPLCEDAKRDLFAALNKWQGIIIVSGPTGSGKSTLLYSSLGAIDRVENNVHTIEDPIEYSLPNLNQTQASRGKLSFADVIRSLMRQDPDVILIGEIRDEETAEAAIHAASTGHLVLSTVHANSAKDIVDRIVGLGVKKDLFLCNLLFASAQRLVPRICPHCAIEDPDSKELVQAVYGVDIIPKKGRGCGQCTNGIKGRVLLFEWMTRARASEPKMHENIGAQALKYLKQGVIDAQSACGLD